MKDIAILSLSLILIIASIWDVKFNKKIPNALIFLGLLAGLTISAYFEGWHGLWSSLLSIVIIQIVFLVFWGAIAAGDIKLFMVIASFLGTGEAIFIALLSFVVGGVVFFTYKPKRAFHSVESMKYFLFYKIPIKPVSKEMSVAFSPFILIAFFITVFI